MVNPKNHVGYFARVGLGLGLLCLGSSAAHGQTLDPLDEPVETDRRAEPAAPIEPVEPMPATPEQAPNISTPGTLTLDRADGSNRVGMQIGFNQRRLSRFGEEFAVRFEPHVQVMIPGTRVGFYAHIPMTYWHGSETPAYTGLGNLDLGGIFLPFRNPNLILRAGLVLPMGSSYWEGRAANASTAYERSTDYVLTLAEQTTLRLSASTVQARGRFFFRADLGVDFVLDEMDALLRCNVAGGVSLPVVNVYVESANMMDLGGDPQSGIGSRLLNTGAIGLGTRGNDQFHLGLVFQPDSTHRDQTWIATLGYHHVFL